MRRRRNPATSTVYRGICLHDPTGRLPDVNLRSDAEIRARVQRSYLGRPGMYGSHWTDDKRTAMDFALGEAEKAYWWDITDPKARVVGVVVEVKQRGASARTKSDMYDLDTDQPGEFGVEAPKPANAIAVKFHVVAMDAGPYPRRRTWVRTIAP